VQDAGVLTGKKRKILRDVSAFLPRYNRLVQIFAMGITRECGSLPIRDMICYDIKLVHPPANNLLSQTFLLQSIF